MYGFWEEAIVMLAIVILAKVGMEGQAGESRKCSRN